jgi:hypothetical protein
MRHAWIALLIARGCGAVEGDKWLLLASDGLWCALRSLRAVQLATF